jgi:hypothetical protein
MFGYKNPEKEHLSNMRKTLLEQTAEEPEPPPRLSTQNDYKKEFMNSVAMSTIIEEQDVKL